MSVDKSLTWPLAKTRRRAGEIGSDQPKHLEAASGIEPLYRVLQTVTRRYLETSQAI